MGSKTGKDVCFGDHVKPKKFITGNTAGDNVSFCLIQSLVHKALKLGDLWSKLLVNEDQLHSNLEKI